jgi:hypothetical protein
MLGGGPARRPAWRAAPAPAAGGLVLAEAARLTLALLLADVSLCCQCRLQQSQVAAQRQHVVLQSERRAQQHAQPGRPVAAAECRGGRLARVTCQQRRCQVAHDGAVLRLLCQLRRLGQKAV